MLQGEGRLASEVLSDGLPSHPQVLIACGDDRAHWPLGLAADESRLYVCDCFTHNVETFQLSHLEAIWHDADSSTESLTLPWNGSVAQVGDDMGVALTAMTFCEDTLFAIGDASVFLLEKSSLEVKRRLTSTELPKAADLIFSALAAIHGRVLVATADRDYNPRSMCDILILSPKGDYLTHFRVQVAFTTFLVANERLYALAIEVNYADDEGDKAEQRLVYRVASDWLEQVPVDLDSHDLKGWRDKACDSSGYLSSTSAKLFQIPEHGVILGECIVPEAKELSAICALSDSQLLVGDFLDRALHTIKAGPGTSCA